MTRSMRSSRTCAKSRKPTPKERTLRATVANWFGNKLDDAAMDRIVGELVKRKVIAIDQGKVRYSLPH